MYLRIAATLILLLSALVPGSAQNAGVNDPTAVALASKVLTQLTGGLPITDVTLSGTVTSFAGSDRNEGSITLQALGTKDSRIDFTFGANGRTEIRAIDPDSAASGAWSGSDAVLHPIAFHNSWTDAVWFFPGLASLATLSDPTVAVSYLGRETRDGLSVEHLRFSRVVASRFADVTKLIAKLSTVDWYLDSTTLLPLECAFTVHPDNNANIDIPVEVRFADYRNVGGVRVPFRFQKLLNGGLVLDVTVQTATFNSGLSVTSFSLQ